MKKRLFMLLLIIVLVASFIPLSTRAASYHTSNSANKYVSNIAFSHHGDLRFPGAVIVDYEFMTEQTDYEIGLTTRSIGTNPCLKLELSDSIGSLWHRFYIDGVHLTTAAYRDSQISASIVYFNLTNALTTLWPNDGQPHTLSIEIGTKSDSDGNGKLDYLDDFVSSDIYNFHITDLPAFSFLSIKDETGVKLPLAPPFLFGSNNQSFIVSTPGSSIRITAEFGSNTTLHIGEISYSEELTDEMIDLSAYQADVNGIKVVPLRLVSSGGAESIYSINVWSVDYTPVITQQPQSVTCSKGDTATMSIAVEAPEGSSLSYQWYRQPNPINGATGDTLQLDTSKAVSNATYWCVITNTVAGTTFSTTSAWANLTVNLTYVDPPVFIHQPGQDIWTKNDGSPGWTGKEYKTTYSENSTFDELFFGYEQPESGVSPRFVFYVNDQPTYEGAQILEGIVHSKSNSNEEIASFETEQIFSKGTYYVGCVITFTANADSTLYASTESEFVKLEFVDWMLDFAGTGSQNDPYQLATTEDMVKLSAYSLGGNKFGNRYFKLMADVTLPEGWQPLGNCWDNRFEGAIDGNSHTLTVPAGGLPLLGYVLGAEVKNLGIFGTQIAGYGLVNNYGITGKSGTAITIDNVTLKSGTKTLKAGLIGADMGANPYAGTSAGYKVIIRNCIAESGIIVGYNGDRSKIGTFAGRFQGSITNCTSAATVKGKDYVGGIVGSDDQAMGDCIIIGCTFTGSVIASGEHAGGIAGGGYDNSSAPNGMKLSILNCSSSGSVTGYNKVGGILGGDSFGFQAWTDHEISGNSFTGTATAMGGTYVGDIIGYYANLNKHDLIYNNTCSGKVYGFVLSVDTSNAKFADDDTTPFGVDKVNGTYYYNSAVDDLATVDKELVYPFGVDQSFTYVAQPNHNRTDDPLGTGTEVTVALLSITGEYKTEYMVGDEALDTTGMTITATMSDGTTQDVAIADAEFTGFDTATPGQKTITVAYGGATTTFTILVKAPEGQTVKVKLTVLGDTHHDMPEGDKGHGLWLGGLTTWLAETEYEVSTNATAWDLISQAFDADDSLTLFSRWTEQYGSEYIYAVQKDDVLLTEKDNCANSGWMVAVNGKHVQTGISLMTLTDGDSVILHWCDDYLADEGAAGGQPTQEDREAAFAVEDLIDEIGTVTLESEAAITAARTAYDALTDVQKGLVSNYDKLTAAEARLTELKAERDQQAAQTVMDMIAAIGDVTIEDEEAIAAARAAYDALTPEQQALVTNLDVLTAAETAIAPLIDERDTQAAGAAAALIEAIPAEVTIEDEAAIIAAREAYDALTEAQKAKVTDYDKLLAAEAALAKLKFGTVKPVVTAANDKKTGKIKLTIEPVEGAVGYKIYVATAADGEYELAGEVTEPTYTHTGKAGQQYYFKVVAVNETGDTSAESEVVNKFQVPAQVTSLKATSKKGQVTLKWKKVTGAKKYFIYMSKNGKTGWKKVGTATKNTFVYKKGKAGTKLYFKVLAVTANGKKGEFSKVVSVKLKK